MFKTLHTLISKYKMIASGEAIILDITEYDKLNNFWEKEHRNMSNVLEQSGVYDFDARLMYLKNIIDLHGQSELFNDVELIKKGYNAKKIMEAKANANLVYIVEAIKSTNPLYNIIILEPNSDGLQIVIDLAFSNVISEQIISDIYRSTSEYYMESSIENGFITDRLCHKIVIHGRHYYSYLNLLIKKINTHIYNTVVDLFKNEKEFSDTIKAVYEYLKDFKRELNGYPNITNLDFGYKDDILSIFESNKELIDKIILHIEGEYLNDVD